MSRTARHRNRRDLSEFHRRVLTGTDKGARIKQRKLAGLLRIATRKLDCAVRALPGSALPSPPDAPQAGTR
jgi:hypothetical protein